MRLLESGKPDFKLFLQKIRSRRGPVPAAVADRVRGILREIEESGDEALFRYTRLFDEFEITSSNMEVTADEIRDGLAGLPQDDLEVLKTAAGRIERYHRKQLIKSRMGAEDGGIRLGYLVRPLERVGVYAPGGLAVYPSTVLMSSIPAKVAGVKEIILCSPAKKGRISPLIIAAAVLGGVSRILKIGGAQAIAAMAFGTRSVPGVDKIVGPGNSYVTEAKRQVFGLVGIDMIAGPSEIMIIADGFSDPAAAAADLISQAEHDPLACSILITPDRSFAGRVLECVASQLRDYSSGSPARSSIAEYGAAFITADLAEAVEVANSLAPEHLELMVENPDELLEGIRNAGAVFLGRYSPEAVGDYLAGPSHVLPTAGTARFSSPLGVYDFQKRTSVISFSEEALAKFAGKTVRFAELEGLPAHGRSVSIRQKPEKS
ncbi:MAG: histidinol dehydrogenase [Syntrophales bacterium]|nr:histidinol dehydrogenase [Syntrophales bacterium]MDD5532263.1 histidinol dehydrogenase [Syntrophales bacterium]